MFFFSKNKKQNFNDKSELIDLRIHVLCLLIFSKAKTAQSSENVLSDICPSFASKNGIRGLMLEACCGTDHLKAAVHHLFCVHVSNSTDTADNSLEGRTFN